MDQSPRLSLSYLMPAQAQKHVTVNETFRRLDQLVQQTVLSRTVVAEPGAPNDGDAYILPASPTGTAWATFGQNNIAAFQDGAWVEILAVEGFSAWVGDADEFVIYDGAAWSEVSGSGETAAKFGVNTTADATNKFAVKSNAVLFDSLNSASESGNDDMIVKVNKEAVGDTASHIFQTAFSSRAETGLTGDDDFHIKVSPDGSSWTDALIIDKDNGRVGLSKTNPAHILHALQATGIATIRVDATADDAQFRMSSGLHANADWSFGTGGTVSANLDDFYVYKQSGTAGPKLIITNGGNVGIGETAPGSKLHVDSGGIQCGNPTGGDKGIGAINAQAVYDDNTLLTCYVFDQALDGAIDDAKWDGKVPDKTIPAEIDVNIETGVKRVVKPEERIVRTHAPMRKFRARIGTLEDPLTLDGYAKHWREKRHLTSMPNEAAFDPTDGQLTTGEWVQRLVETVEIQAILIEELNTRVKTLEAATPSAR